MVEVHVKPKDHRFKDIQGEKFSRWTAISYAGPINGKHHWNCACECGRTGRIDGTSLRIGNSKSCGCYKADNPGAKTHGATCSNRVNAEYKCWLHMIARCTNPSEGGYERYGERGISVCERWITSFEAFRDDMGPRPSARNSIDRIDNNGNYEPSNCRWATQLQQVRNRSNTRTLTFMGETKTLQEWADERGIKYPTLYRRVVIMGQSANQALTQ